MYSIISTLRNGILGLFLDDKPIYDKELFVDLFDDTVVIVQRF